LILSLIFGTAYWKLGHNQADAGLRVSLLFFAALMGNLTAFAFMFPVFEYRPLFYRERAEGMYHVAAFGIARILTDIPGVLSSAIAFSIPLYWLAGFQYNAGKFFFFLLAIIGLNLAAVALGQFIATCNPTAETATLIFGSILAFFALTAGFLIKRTDIPPWFIWGYWISIFRYTIEALVDNEFKGLLLGCPNNEDAYPVPVVLPNGNTVTKFYCQFHRGEQFIQSFEMYPSLQWPDIAVLYGYFFLFTFLTVVCTKLINHQKR